jgi:hypothetical protein
MFIGQIQTYGQTCLMKQIRQVKRVSGIASGYQSHMHAEFNPAFLRSKCLITVREDTDQVVR